MRINTSFANRDKKQIPPLKINIMLIQKQKQRSLPHKPRSTSDRLEQKHYKTKSNLLDS